MATTKRLNIEVRQHGASGAQREMKTLGSRVSDLVSKYGMLAAKVTAVTVVFKKMHAKTYVHRG